METKQMTPEQFTQLLEAIRHVQTQVYIAHIFITLQLLWIGLAITTRK